MLSLSLPYTRKRSTNAPLSLPTQGKGRPDPFFTDHPSSKSNRVVAFFACTTVYCLCNACCTYLKYQKGSLHQGEWRWNLQAAAEFVICFITGHTEVPRIATAGGFCVWSCRRKVVILSVRNIIHAEGSKCYEESVASTRYNSCGLCSVCRTRAFH